MPVFRIKIITLEALKPLTTRSFTKSCLTVSTWEHSMSLSYSFLQMKAENQNFPPMARIWLENWHLRLRINLWWKLKCCVERCPSLPCDIFDLPISTGTYCCSHLSKNGRSKVVHLIHFSAFWSTYQIRRNRKQCWQNVDVNGPHHGPYQLGFFLAPLP